MNQGQGHFDPAPGSLEWSDATDQQLLILLSLLANDGVPDYLDFAKRLKSWIAGEGFGPEELSGRVAEGVGLTVFGVVGHPNFEQDPHQSAFEVWPRGRPASGAAMRTGEQQWLFRAGQCANRDFVLTR
jgi:hypothetical protein